MEKKYKAECVFEAHGYKCAVVLQRMGHRCGYVGVTRSHPLYGEDYDAKLPIKITDDECKDLEIVNPIAALLNVWSDDDDIRLDCFFQVHGGITYAAGSSDYPIENNDLWWFGFDCAHAGDAPDEDAVMEYFGIAPMFSLGLGEDIIRTTGYAVDETVKLAGQLREYENRFGREQK